jgi:hypothetical protein|tara:strand:- start:12536 stop:12727 length:192 start_codon:yes stop_codon:yes gene_type:complete
MDNLEEYWGNRHAKRKIEIISLLEKYVKVRGVSKIDVINEKFEYQIQKLRDELNTINKLQDVM